jgi:hypothetical protein
MPTGNCTIFKGSGGDGAFMLARWYQDDLLTGSRYLSRDVGLRATPVTGRQH